MVYLPQKRNYLKHLTPCAPCAPFAPCGALCRSNGYDEKKRRISFICRKQSLTSSFAVPDLIKNCRYIENECGCSTHMSIKAHPRLACITTLLKRMMRFLIGSTVNLMRYLKTWERSYKNKFSVNSPLIYQFFIHFSVKKLSS